MTADTRKLLRKGSGDARSDVTFVELFFDLVFVFAITQLSHSLLAHLDVVGALQTTLLLIAVWWAWIHTSWVTNWLDPDRLSVRLMLYGLMLTGFVMSTALPQAFGASGLLFAGAIVASHLGRSLFMLWALHDTSVGNFRNFRRILIWQMLASVFWLAGGFASGPFRFALWAVAAAIECTGPAVGFRVPGLGRSTTDDWDVDGSHIAERCSLFIIIALGESLLVTGATAAKLPLSGSTGAAFLSAFIGTVAMWWVYFNIGEARARERIADSDDPGRLARLAYTYIHVVLVAGIIVVAVGDEIVLQHPSGHSEPSAIIVLLGGPALFLAGNLWFKWVTGGWPPLSHWVGLAILLALAPIGYLLPPLALSMASTAVLVMVAVWETRSLGGGRLPHEEV